MRCKGFTLLEMLFVLLVVGLMSAIAVPRFAGNYERKQLVTQRQAIVSQLIELPRRARLLSRPVNLPQDLALADLGDGMAVLSVPEGWVVVVDPGLVISMLGACSAGIVTLRHDAHPELDARLNIAAPTCDLLP